MQDLSEDRVLDKCIGHIPLKPVLTLEAEIFAFREFLQSLVGSVCLNLIMQMIFVESNKVHPQFWA